MRRVQICIAALIIHFIFPIADAAPPNVVLIMTDDQGYGDFGVTGNPVIATPQLDAMAAQSVSMRTFYVSPVCSPTRASLLTGRYNYRTRAIDTFIGRSMMEPAEVTIAEVLRGAGYATGIFGKWHLGDCYPMRAMDQGFGESLVIRGGGIGQPSDPIGAEGRYTNPILVHNGVLEATTGFCTDVYFEAAMKWIEREHAAGRPFFAYIATNAPHGPFNDVPETLRTAYQQKDLAQLTVSANGDASRREAEAETLSRIAAMITNVDDNVGKLLATLDALGLTENTLVIFLCDNGPNTMRYVGPFRGQKSEVFEGGVRSPFWMRWPDRLNGGYTRDEPVAHIDVMPTILEACGVSVPTGVKLDGRSFWKLATGANGEWPVRPLVIQSHRGDMPVRNHQFMIREENWKLLHASGFGRETFAGAPNYELYDLAADPRETRNMVDAEPEVAARLLSEYGAWFDDVSGTRPDNYAPPRIHLGTAHENQTVLTRQDWRGGTWDADSIGYWLVTIEQGQYDVTATFPPNARAETIEMRVDEVVLIAELAANTTEHDFQDVELPSGDAEFRVSLRHGESARSPHQVEVRRN